jgi:hypothetical protein
VNGPFRHDAASWSPVESLVADEPEAAKPPRGPSLIFAIAIIAGVAALTAGAVMTFFVEPSEGAPEEKLAVAVEEPVLTASLEPMLPVRKVVTKPVPVARATTPPEPTQTAQLEDVDMLEQQDPRWARSGSEKSAAAFASMLQPAASSREGSIAGTGAVALVDPSPAGADESMDDTETAAIEPGQIKPKRAQKAKPDKPAANAAVDDNTVAPPGLKAPTRTVQVSKGVNMRSRPKSGSRVLTVVPKAAAVQVVGCKVWCEIVYKGRRGYVFKDFVGGKAQVAAKPKAVAKETKTVWTSSQEPEGPPQPPRVKAISSRLR